MWLCAQTQPKRELLVLNQLRERAGKTVYAPRFKAPRKSAKGKAQRIQFLFPSYLFVRCDAEGDPRLVRYTMGVLRLVSRGERPIPVPEEVIDQLQEAYPAEHPLELEDPALDPGSEVEILEGSLKDLRGTVLAYLPAEQRIRVLIEFLGRDLEVTIPAATAFAARPSDRITARPPDRPTALSKRSADHAISTRRRTDS